MADEKKVKPRRKVTKMLTPWRRETGPEIDAAMRFAQRRVSFLEGRAFDEPLRYLLACAYLQGITDSCQAHLRNPSLCPTDVGLEEIAWA